MRTKRAVSSFHANFYNGCGLAGFLAPDLPSPSRWRRVLPRLEGALWTSFRRALTGGDWGLVAGLEMDDLSWVAFAGLMKDIPADWAWFCTQLPSICLLMCS